MQIVAVSPGFNITASYLEITNPGSSERLEMKKNGCTAFKAGMKSMAPWYVS
jgi:hypothetical protein